MRALYEWIVDNDCTPYLLVDAAVPGVNVPRQYVKDGQIVLNISPGDIIQTTLAVEIILFLLSRTSDANALALGIGVSSKLPSIAYLLGSFRRRK